jgi:hypothetical protein
MHLFTLLFDFKGVHSVVNVHVKHLTTSRCCKECGLSLIAIDFRVLRECEICHKAIKDHNVVSW